MNLKLLLVLTTAFLAGTSVSQSGSAAQVKEPSTEVQTLIAEATQKSAQPKDRISILERALAKSRELKDRSGEGRVLSLFGTTYQDLQLFPDALRYLQDALPIHRELGDSIREATTLHEIGSVCNRLGQREIAIQNYELALAVRIKLGDRSGQADDLNGIGIVYFMADEIAKSGDYFERALQIWRELGDRAKEGIGLANLGALYRSLGKSDKALECFESALPILRSVGDRKNEGAALTHLGLLYRRTGNNSKALECYQSALPILREFGDKLGESTLLNNMANIYASLGQLQKALAMYESRRSIDRELGNRSGEGTTLNNIGYVYYKTGQYSKAREYYESALSIRREIKDRSGQASTLSNLGVLYKNLGQLDKALEVYELALPICREIRDRRQEATTLNNIASLHMRRGQVQKAMEYEELVLSIYREVGDRSGEGSALNNIGQLHLELGRPQMALASHVAALPILQETRNRSGEGAALDNIGACYVKLGQRDRALEHYIRALSILRELGEISVEQRTLADLREAFARDHPKLATYFGKASVNIDQKLRKNTESLPRDFQDSHTATIADNYRDLADLLVSQGRLPEAEHALRLLKDEELLEFVRRTDDSLGGLMAYTPTESKWNKEYEIHLRNLADVGGREQSLLIVKERTTEQEAELTTIQEKLREAEDAFKKFIDRIQAESKSGGAESPTAVKGYKGIQSTLAALPKGTVAVYTIVSPSSLRLVFLTPTRAQARTVNVSSSELSKRIQAFRKSLQNRLPDVKKQGLNLYQLLIKPIEQDLKQSKAQDIMWSLDGPLRYIPVGALWDGKNYLIEKYGTSIFNPSSAEGLHVQPLTKDSALAAGVSTGRKVVEEDGTEHRFQPLAGVPKELASVASAFKGTKKLMDSSFTLKNFESELLKQPKLVHLATHFVFRAGDETKSFLLTGQGPVLGVAEARKINELTLKNVSLLTLSACETGLGGTYGDGSEVESIAVIFQRKGAKALLATLWPVADTSTQPLIAEFYREWSANPKAGKSNALRKAQIAMVRGEIKVAAKNGKVSKTNRFAHPFYWAPFVLSGNSR